MTRRVGIGLIALGVVFVVGFSLSRLISAGRCRPKLERELSAALGRQVRVGTVSLSLFDGKVGANNISIADDPTVSNDVFLTAKSLSAEVKLRPLIVSQTLQITSITLEEPQIRLIRGPAGTWNFSSLGKGAAEAKPSGKRAGAPCTGTLTVDKLTIEKGRVVVWTANPAEMPVTYENVNVNITGFSSTTQLPFEVSAGLRRRGELNLNGQCTPMNAGNTATTSLNPYLQFRKLDLAPSGFVSRGTVMAGLTNIGSQTTWIGQVKTTKTLRDEKLSLIVIGAPSTSISISRRSSVSSKWNLIREHFAQTLLTRHEMGIRLDIDSGSEELASVFLLRSYLRDTKWIRSWKSTQEMKEFQAYIGYFKKYAAQYDFDYLMLVAQAYQESRLDQSRTSPVGAVGIMQVIPEFAAAPPINIPDVMTPEANIHAGAKMLRHFYRAYFKNDGIDEMNKTLLSFASYNAGPSRIAKLRNQAEREGLDPNQWFDNVERVVAREVGQETVRYVSNIYDRYVAYKLALEHGRGTPYAKLAVAR